jgi:protein-S-isoprenylcysteine O-methyltransferase Ste14
VIPAAGILLPWFGFAGYQAPGAAFFLGAALMAASVLLLWRAHSDLGRGWTTAMSVHTELVDTGVYRYIRHPIYAAILIWALAQPLLLHNWIGGFAGLAAVIPFIAIRLPYEETMLKEHFGEAYHLYIRRTGAILPRIG